MKGIIERFRRPVKDEPAEYKKLLSAAHRCLNNREGEYLLDHLIAEFKLDDMGGCLPSDESNYRNGTHDVIKYILALTTEKE